MPVPVSTNPQSDVVARLMEEGAIGMTQAAKLVGTFREGKPTCSTTVARWVQKGVSLNGGKIVKLEAFRLNGRLCTSKAALIRFIQAQNDSPTVAPAPAAITPDTPTQRKSRSQAASTELDAVLASI